MTTKRKLESGGGQGPAAKRGARGKGGSQTLTYTTKAGTTHTLAGFRLCRYVKHKVSVLDRTSYLKQGHKLGAVLTFNLKPDTYYAHPTGRIVNAQRGRLLEPKGEQIGLCLAETIPNSNKHVQKNFRKTHVLLCALRPDMEVT